MVCQTCFYHQDAHLRRDRDAKVGEGPMEERDGGNNLYEMYKNIEQVGSKVVGMHVLSEGVHELDAPYLGRESEENVLKVLGGLLIEVAIPTATIH